MKVIGLVVAAAMFSGAPVAKHRGAVAPAAANEVRGSGDRLPPPAWARKDPADSLYREAREALSRGDYSRAAGLFGRVVERYPKSAYAGESLYYQAFSMYRSGGTEKLKRARTLLSKLQSAYPDVARRGDVSTLRTRICGELARTGDARCAAEVSAVATSMGASVASAVIAGVDAAVAAGVGAAASAIAATSVRAATDAATLSAIAAARSGSRSTPSARVSGCPSENDDDDERIAALNALLQMDAARAMPILSKVLDRRDACAAGLRRKAVFLVSQKRTPETADILLRVARNDPDKEVREQAVFWLSQVSDERAVDMLQEILRTSRDEDLQNKALFALSQHRSGRGTATLREFAGREGTSDELRGQAIFWLGQRKSAENTEFLRSLYSRLRNNELKDKILFSLSQQRGVGNDQWLMNVAVNASEPIELRKQALFWAGQSGTSLDQLIQFYSRMRETEMRDQMIFVFSQRNSPQAVDKLLDIAKNDPNPELRKKALFWLGQSRDPRVQQFLLDLINR